VNLAWREIRRQKLRFLATAVGLGLLFAVVLAMGGIYKGMVEDATLLIDSLGADFWIVQRDTHGPFAERSVIPISVERRARSLPGVEWARSFSTITVEREVGDRNVRLSLVSLSWPDDRGAWLPLREGRALNAAHREIVVDASLGLELGSEVPLGDEHYRVVGVTSGMVGSGGDGLAFLTLSDLLRVSSYMPPEARRLARAAAGGNSASSGGVQVSAVLVRMKDGADRERAAEQLAGWSDVSAWPTSTQQSFVLLGLVDKARRQIGLFRVILVIVSSIVVSQIVYNMTTAKTREIALLKLMGARTRVIVGMILQQSLLLSALAYLAALGTGALVFPIFPRRVVVGPEEMLTAGLLLAAIGLFSSLAAIYRALRTSPMTILAG